MNANHKLTKTIKGRTIKNVTQANESSLEITFDYNSKMQIKTASGAGLKPIDLTDLTVNNVQQQDTTLRLHRDG